MKRTPLKGNTPLKKTKGFKAIKRDPFDELFSEFIRKRAMKRVGGCERCLTPKKSYKQLQCAHCHGRARKSVRYDPDNAIGICAGCHNYFGGQPHEQIEFFKTHLGEERYNLLLGRMRITHPKPDKKAIELYLKNEIKEMDDNVGQDCILTD